MAAINRGVRVKRWMAQTDERRTEAPQRLARHQLQRPFSMNHLLMFKGSGFIPVHLINNTITTNESLPS